MTKAQDSTKGLFGPSRYGSASDINWRRPWLTEDGEIRVTIDGKDIPVPEGIHTPDAKLTLTKAQWKQLDGLGSSQFRLRTPLVSWLISNGLVLTSSMIGEGERAPSIRDLTWSGLPLPMARHDFNPPTVELCEASAGKVGEAVEKMVVGLGEPFRVSPQIEDIKPIYGLSNHPHTIRVKVSDTMSVRKRIEQGIQDLRDMKYWGPYCVVYGAGHSPNLHLDLVGTPVETTHQKEASKTVREDILADETLRVEGIIQCDLPDFQPTSLIVFQATSDVIRMVNALPLACIQWGGTFMWMTICVPQIRCDCHNNAGIVIIEQ